MKLTFSENFIGVLQKMDNKISKSLLSINDLDTAYNYIDLTDQKDLVSFTPTVKIKEILGNKPQVFVLTDERRNLTYSDINNPIFNALGYDKTKGDMWGMEPHQKAIILAETTSKTTGKVYALIQEFGENIDNPRLAVINKNCISLKDDDSIVWKSSRNNLKIGRLARAILSDAKVEFIAKDIEDFTNQFKATYDFTKDVLKQFDVVDGDDIAHWYHRKNYEEGRGVLNNSCMGEVEPRFLDIYTKNKQVKLIILYGDSGILGSDNKYACDKIKGRALLWEAEIDGKSVKFMDRVYTKNDSDVNLFIKFAQENKFWYKESQSMYPDINLTDGNSVLDQSIKVNVSLDRIEFARYPYMDTLCYGNVSNKTLTNAHEEHERMFRRTGGDYIDKDGNVSFGEDLEIENSEVENSEVENSEVENPEVENPEIENSEIEN